MENKTLEEKREAWNNIIRATWNKQDLNIIAIASAYIEALQEELAEYIRNSEHHY